MAVDSHSVSQLWCQSSLLEPKFCPGGLSRGIRAELPQSFSGGTRVRRPLAGCRHTTYNPHMDKACTWIHTTHADTHCVHRHQCKEIHHCPRAGAQTYRTHTQLEQHTCRHTKAHRCTSAYTRLTRTHKWTYTQTDSMHTDMHRYTATCRSGHFEL